MEADHKTEKSLRSADIWGQIDPALLAGTEPFEGVGAAPDLLRLEKKLRASVLARARRGFPEAQAVMNPASARSRTRPLFSGSFARFATVAAAIVLVIGGSLIANALGLIGLIPSTTTTTAEASTTGATCTASTTAATKPTAATTAGTTAAYTTNEPTGATTSSSALQPFFLSAYFDVDIRDVQCIRIIRFDQDGVEQSRIITTNVQSIQDIGDLVSRIEIEALTGFQPSGMSYEIAFSRSPGTDDFSEAARLTFQACPGQDGLAIGGSFAEALHVPPDHVLCVINPPITWDEVSRMLEQILSGPE